MRTVARFWLFAAASLAFLAPASASADGLCKVNESPCAAANAWPVGTVLNTEIRPQTAIVFNGLIEFRCTFSSWSGKLTGNPTFGTAFFLDGQSEIFNGCTKSGGAECKVKASEFWGGGAKWFANTESPGDGYTSGTIPIARKIEISCGSLFCNWGLSEGPGSSSHTYKGGNPAIESWKWLYLAAKGSSPTCGGETIMTGER